MGDVDEKRRSLWLDPAVGHVGFVVLVCVLVAGPNLFADTRPVLLRLASVCPICVSGVVSLVYASEMRRKQFRGLPFEVGLLFLWSFVGVLVPDVFPGAYSSTAREVLVYSIATALCVAAVVLMGERLRRSEPERVKLVETLGLGV